MIHNVITTKRLRTFQFAGQILAPARWSLERTFFASSTLIYNWIKVKFKSPEMQFPNDVETFSEDISGVSVGIVFKPNSVFSMRTMHPDTSVAGRNWITEAEIQISDGKIILAIRNTCTLLSDSTEPYESVSAPVFFFEIMKSYGLVDHTWQLSQSPFVLPDMSTLIRLKDFINDKERSYPIVVISEQNQMRHANYEMFPAFLINPLCVAQKLSMVAHVVQMSNTLTPEWFALVGEEWAVFDGAVRIYYPGADLSGEDYFQHPLFIKDRIIASSWFFEDGTEYKEGDAFFYKLKNRLYYHHKAERDLWSRHNIKFYYDQFAEWMAERQKNESEDRELKRLLLQNEIDALRSSNEDLKGDIDANYDLLLKHDALLDEYKKDYGQLRLAYNAIRVQFEEYKGRKIDEDAPIPDNYTDMPKWVDNYLSGRLLLHNRAINALKSAEYEDVSLVYHALLLLANEYRNMKLDYDNAYNLYCSARDKLVLEDTGAITDTSAGEQGDTYYVDYHGRKVKLDRHLRKGTSHNPKNCLRIYFFWDDEDELIVVGGLPYHLTTRQS